MGQESKFNLAEIFEIAEQIERNGVDFYKHAAKKFKDVPELKELLLKLADDEKKHERIFKDFKKAFTDKTINDETCDETALMYLDAIAGQFVFGDKENKEREIFSSLSKQDIFKFGIKIEKDSILFYLGLKDAIVDPNDKRAIDLLIDEEKRHLTDLTKYSEIYGYLLV